MIAKRNLQDSEIAYQLPEKGGEAVEFKIRIITATTTFIIYYVCESDTGYIKSYLYCAASVQQCLGRNR